jgi:hypothetical protein
MGTQKKKHNLSYLWARWSYPFPLETCLKFSRFRSGSKIEKKKKLGW